MTYLINSTLEVASYLYKKATKQPILPLTEQITQHVQMSLNSPEHQNPVTTYSEIDFSYLIPRIKRAHVISDPDLIKSVLKIERNGEFFQAGVHDTFQDLMGTHNMLLSSDHDRLRKPLEKFFSEKSVQSPQISREISFLAQQCIDPIVERKIKIETGIQTFIVGAVLKTLFGIQMSEDAASIVTAMDNFTPTNYKETGAILRKSLQSILANKTYEEGRTLDLLQSQLTEEETLSTAILLLSASTHSSVQFLNFLIATLRTRGDLRGEIALELFKSNTSPTLDACMLEIERLYPIFPDISRIAKKPMQIGALSIQTGDLIHCNILGSQRQNPQLGDDLLHFNPNRFLEEAKRGSKLATFGGGHGRCLGKFFAKNEIKIFAQQFARRYHSEMATLLLKTIQPRVSFDRRFLVTEFQ